MHIHVWKGHKNEILHLIRGWAYAGFFQCGCFKIGCRAWCPSYQPWQSHSSWGGGGGIQHFFSFLKTFASIFHKRAILIHITNLSLNRYTTPTPAYMPVLDLGFNIWIVLFCPCSGFTQWSADLLILPALRAVWVPRPHPRECLHHGQSDQCLHVAQCKYRFTNQTSEK